MNSAEKEELIIKFNEIRLSLKDISKNDETAAEITDLINTIIEILIKK